MGKEYAPENPTRERITMAMVAMVVAACIALIAYQFINRPTLLTSVCAFVEAGLFVYIVVVLVYPDAFDMLLPKAYRRWLKTSLTTYACGFAVVIALYFFAFARPDEWWQPAAAGSIGGIVSACTYLMWISRYR